MVIRVPARSAAAIIEKSDFRGPPLRGVNARNSIISMDKNFALAADNWVCKQDGFHIRQGKVKQATGLGSGALSVFSSPSNLFVATATSVFDVTSVIDNPTPVLTGLTSGKWTTGVISNPGGAFLIAANDGTDGVKVFNGTAWITAAITNVDATNLVCVCIHQNRAFFIEKGTLRIWYLDFFAFQGEARKIDVTAYCRKGGELISLGSQSPDGGRGRGDKIYAVTSEGEMIVYAGTNPAQSKSWQLENTYDVPKPIGRSCFCNNGTNMLYISVDGIMTLPRLLTKAEDDYKPDAITDQIRMDYAADVSLTTSSPNDWCAVEGSFDGLLVVNVPLPSGSYQYAIAPETNGLSYLSGFKASCWASFKRRLYFGDTDGKVFMYGGHSDDSQPISAFMCESLQRYGVSRKKTFTRALPHLTAGGAMRVGVLNETTLPPSAFDALNIRSDGGPWYWHHLSWPDMPAQWLRGGVTPRSMRWHGVRGRGLYGAFMLGIKATVPTIYQGNDIGFQVGGQE